MMNGRRIDDEELKAGRNDDGLGGTNEAFFGISPEEGGKKLWKTQNSKSLKKKYLGRNFSQLRQSKKKLLMKSSLGSSSSGSLDTLRGQKKKIILVNLNRTESKGPIRDENAESIEEPTSYTLKRRFVTPEKERKRSKQVEVETQMSIIASRQDEERLRLTPHYVEA